MDALERFMGNFDWQRLLMALVSALLALVCLTIHELSHGLAAYRLGDTTAKDAGRLTLNPIRHIDWLGFLLMVTAHVGWAKPVPVDIRRFKRPKADMALTALAGPASNFLLAWVFLLIAHLLYAVLPFRALWQSYLLIFFLQGALLSVGLGVFNLIPIPPLDGSRVLFSVFPDKIYYTLLRYERYIALLLLAAVWWGLLDAPLSFLISHAMRALCFLSGFPYGLYAGLFT